MDNGIFYLLKICAGTYFAVPLLLMKKTGLLLALLCCSFHEVIAQGCTVCTQTAAGLGASSAQGLNSGILYLASIPLLFMGTVGYIWYRRSKTTATEE